MRAIILTFIFLSSFANAQKVDSYLNRTIDPVRKISDVHAKSKSENVVRLKRAKIAIVDYDLIRKDFPDLVKLSNPQIDDWLLNQVAFISKPQSDQTVVNTAIDVVENNTREAYRPPRYGRALVYETEFQGKQLGLIDVKGTGALRPAQLDHRNGLMSLGESLREFSYEKMVSSIFDHAGVTTKTVGSYAVIDAGFDVVHADGSRSAAGLYLRQAHHRMAQDFIPLNEIEPIESLFENYGVFANKNFQVTSSGDVFDFGHYIVRQDMGRTRGQYSIPFEQWGFEIDQGDTIRDYHSSSDPWKYSKRDRPWIWSHDTAEAFATGRATRHDVWMTHYNLVHPVQEKLSKTARIYGLSRNFGMPIRLCEQVFDLRAR